MLLIVTLHCHPTWIHEWMDECTVPLRSFFGFLVFYLLFSWSLPPNKQIYVYTYTQIHTQAYLHIHTYAYPHILDQYFSTILKLVTTWIKITWTQIPRIHPTWFSSSRLWKAHEPTLSVPRSVIWMPIKAVFTTLANIRVTWSFKNAMLGLHP